MKILTFDTSADKLFITLGEKDKVELTEIICNTKEKYNSALLIPTIAKLLQTKNLTMQDIEAIGVNIGPGSFTGIRASATVARVIGQSLNIPVVGIPSLEIIASANHTQKNTLCLIDARKGKVYTAIYKNSGDIIKNPDLLSLDECWQLIEENDFFIITDNLMAKKLDEKQINYLNFQQTDINFGLSLAELAYKYILDKDKSFNWYELKPLYIQPPPVTMPKVKK